MPSNAKPKLMMRFSIQERSRHSKVSWNTPIMVLNAEETSHQPANAATGARGALDMASKCSPMKPSTCSGARWVRKELADTSPVLLRTTAEAVHPARPSIGTKAKKRSKAIAFAVRTDWCRIKEANSQYKRVRSVVAVKNLVNRALYFSENSQIWIS